MLRTIGIIFAAFFILWALQRYSGFIAERFFTPAPPKEG